MAQQQKRQKLPKLTSPRGIFRFPALITPDYGTKEFPKKDGQYKVGLILPESGKATEAFLEAVKVHHDAALVAGQEEYDGLKRAAKDKLEAKGVTGPVAQPFFSKQYDKETDEPTGNIVLNFTKKASGTRKDDTKWVAKRPGIFDARGNPIASKAIKIWGGTEGKISFEMRPYFIPASGLTGLSLILRSAQIIKLVSEGVMNAEDEGFTDEGEGFEYDAGDFEDETENATDADTEAKDEPVSEEADDF